MAKLPGISYGTAVPSMGRQDPFGPVRVANAQAAAARAVGQSATDIGNMVKEMDEEEGRNAASEAGEVFTLAIAEAQANPNIGERIEQMEVAKRDVESEFKHKLGGIATRTFDETFSKWATSKITEQTATNILEREDQLRKSTFTRIMVEARQGDLSSLSAPDRSR